MNLLKERLIALGVPASVSFETVAIVQKWLERSGPEWTVNRLKQLKQELISRLSDGDFRAPWVGRNKDSLPRGPFSWFFRQALSMRDDKISLAINSLMIYSSFVSESITENQRKKFFSSMESTDETGLLSTPKLHPRISKDHPAQLVRYWPLYFLKPAMSPNKYQPGIDSKSYPEDDYVEQFKFVLGSSVCRSLIINHSQYAKASLPLDHYMMCSPDVIADPVRSLNAHPVVRQCVGKISFIQEPGYKLRAVANPSRIIQCMLNPLKGFLKELLLELPTDCTNDQDSGIARIQGWLREGKRCHSIDLSDATNTFPRNYQISLAGKMIDQVVDEEYRQTLLESLEILTECCEAPWFSKEGNTVTKHRFTRGQPLGLGPSFFLFAYTHNVLLEGLCVKHGIQNSPFVVLGDDVCISNEDLARLYRATLNNLGCKISESKSIVSEKFAEFAGVLITPVRRIHQHKWRDLTDSNFIDFCRQFGHRSVKLLTRRQRAVIEAIAEIPSEIGGMGWNPKGKSLHERLSTPIAQMLLEKSESSILYESVWSKDRKFWSNVKYRKLIRYQELLDPGFAPRLLHSGDQPVNLGRQIQYWDRGWARLEHDAREAYGSLQRPYPDYVLVREGVNPPPGYVVSMPVAGDPRKIRDVCTISLIERKIRSVAVSE